MGSYPNFAYQPKYSSEMNGEPDQYDPYRAYAAHPSSSKPLPSFHARQESHHAYARQPIPFGGPPGYNVARLPPKPVKYSFSQSSLNSMLLIPEANSPDSRPLYHISVFLNCFNPTSATTVVRRGATEDGKIVGQFELGISSEDASVTIRGAEMWMKEVLSKKGSHLNGLWSWNPPDSQKIIWDCLSEARWCYFAADRAKKQLAVFYPAKKKSTSSISQILLYPDGQPVFDDIVLSALIVERHRLMPPGDASKVMFGASYRKDSDFHVPDAISFAK